MIEVAAPRDIEKRFDGKAGILHRGRVAGDFEQRAVVADDDAERFFQFADMRVVGPGQHLGQLGGPNVDGEGAILGFCHYA